MKNIYFTNEFSCIINLFTKIQYKRSQKFYLLIQGNLFNIKAINKVFNNKKDFYILYY